MISQFYHNETMDIMNISKEILKLKEIILKYYFEIINILLHKIQYTLIHGEYESWRLLGFSVNTN